MAAIATVRQQPQDIRDYDLDFDEWFPVGDVITTATATVTPSGGLTANVTFLARVVKVWLRDGVSGQTYKVTVLASTDDGRAKEVELKVRVKDD
jgi:hypothetical protein